MALYYVASGFARNKHADSKIVYDLFGERIITSPTYSREISTKSMKVNLEKTYFLYN